MFDCQVLGSSADQQVQAAQALNEITSRVEALTCEA
jgi:hypothetical protein